MSEQKPAWFALASTSRNTILKIQSEKTICNHIGLVYLAEQYLVIVSYVLAFVQLTWQIDNG